MIPRIIHQTWKTGDVPQIFRAYCATWRDHNPGWEYRLWTDRDLLDFVAAHYPAHLDTFCGYRQGVQRADAGRYMLLHHFGGVYADLDTECRQSLEPLVSENRVVLCLEPRVHWTWINSFRGFHRLIFNGVMAGPEGHAFWPHLLERMEGVRDSPEVIDSTGPCLLTGAVESFPAAAAIRIDGARLFNPRDTYGQIAAEDEAGECYAVHHWAATWWQDGEGNKTTWMKRKWSSIAKRFYRWRASRGGGPSLDPKLARESVSAAAIARPVPSGRNVAILVPVRDASPHISGFLTAIGRLDFPKERLKLVFCEGDSQDSSLDDLLRQTEPLKSLYRGAIVLRKNVGSQPGAERWRVSIQRVRRAGIAKVRNHLIDHGLDETDDWALWMDIDVWRFPPDIIARLIAAKARIVAPNCVTRRNGPSFDQNSFVTRDARRDHRYYRMIKDGLFQPPAPYPRRLLLSDLRHSDRVPLDGVGGTMLLVDAALHRGGLRFPELPYDDLIETEGFGRLARDCGVQPIGLPRVEILHVPW